MTKTPIDRRSSREAKDFSTAVERTLSANVQEFKTAGGPSSFQGRHLKPYLMYLISDYF